MVEKISFFSLQKKEQNIKNYCSVLSIKLKRLLKGMKLCYFMKYYLGIL